MNMTDIICTKITAKDLIKDGQDDYYNGLNNSIENTMWLLIRLTDDMGYYLSEEEIQKIADDELNMGGIITPYCYEYHIINKAKKANGRKVVDKRNKKEVEQIERICRIAHNLYTIGVENPEMDL